MSLGVIRKHMNVGTITKQGIFKGLLGLLLIVAILLPLIAALAISVYFVGLLNPLPSEAALTIRPGEKLAESRGNQILLSNIRIDGVNKKIVDFEIIKAEGFTYLEKNDDYGWDANESISSELTILIPPAEKIELTFGSHKWAGSIYVDYNGRTEHFILYNDEYIAKTIELQGAKSYPSIKKISIIVFTDLALYCICIILALMGFNQLYFICTAKYIINPILNLALFLTARITSFLESKSTKSKLVRPILFTVLLVILVTQAQNILSYKWENSESLKARLLNYTNEADNTIDVFFIGTSAI